MRNIKLGMIAGLFTLTMISPVLAQAGGGAAGGAASGTGSSAAPAGGAPGAAGGSGVGTSTTGGAAIGTTGRATDPTSRTEIRKEKEVEEGATPSTVPK